jgi:hypothetical protein
MVRPAVRPERHRHAPAGAPPTASRMSTAFRGERFSASVTAVVVSHICSLYTAITFVMFPRNHTIRISLADDPAATASQPTPGVRSGGTTPAAAEPAALTKADAERILASDEPPRVHPGRLAGDVIRRVLRRERGVLATWNRTCCRAPGRVRSSRPTPRATPSRTLAARIADADSHLLAHGESRGGLGSGQRLLRYANGSRSPRSATTICGGGSASTSPGSRLSRSACTRSGTAFFRARRGMRWPQQQSAAG